MIIGGKGAHRRYSISALATLFGTGFNKLVWLPSGFFVIFIFFDYGDYWEMVAL